MDDLDWVDDEGNSSEADETLWRRLEDFRYKDGYKDGTVEGGERALQTGFNLGYKQTIKQLYQVAKMKGVVMNVIELMQAEGLSEQLQKENDGLKQELEEDWAEYVNHLKNVGKPFINNSLFPANPSASSNDEIEVKSGSAVDDIPCSRDDIPCTRDELCCKPKPEMPLSTDTELGSEGASSKLNSTSSTLSVDNSDNQALDPDDKLLEKTTDSTKIAGLKKPEDNKASNLMAVVDKLSDLTSAESKMPEISATESTCLKGMSNEGIQNPCDIMSVLACDLDIHTDDLDSMGKCLIEKYLPKLEMLLRKWQT